MYYLGYDIGSSSIKAALVDAESNKPIKVVQYPESEMDIISRRQGWAEQNPEVWWENIIQATRKLFADLESKYRDGVLGIGISYQMHGLVLVDKDQNVLRPSIIWCDSRAVEIGNELFEKLGPQKCLDHLLNSPGNFTASKLKWVKDNEPESYNRIHKLMLPGDYIAMKLTGDINTTVCGLSEGMMWDFKENNPANFLFDEFGIQECMIPEVRDVFSNHGQLLNVVADLLGLPAGIPVGYRSGDQPNNAMSLGVLNAGEVAATGGTSGVVYGVVDQLSYDEDSRVNSFAHVNHCHDNPKIGILLCINGAGIQYRWVKQQMASDGTSYVDMERMISSVPVNSEGLRIIPFGNGAERILENKDIGSHVMNLHFNRHNRAHFYRASLEGIAYSFIYGMEILNDMGMKVSRIKVGNDNLFQSTVFSTTIASLLQCEIDVVETTGAVGAAKAIGYTLKHRSSLKEAMSGNKLVKSISPTNINGEYAHGYNVWKSDLTNLLKI
ncbi:MAG: FGGY family carbohydrate kinase [bacterium]|nr:FGGY family carbohydrate kinase [bacterium]